MMKRIITLLKNVDLRNLGLDLGRHTSLKGLRKNRKSEIIKPILK